MAESQVLKKIQEGDKTMIIFWLKNHHKSYNEKIYHRHEHRLEKEENDITPEEIIEQIQAGFNMGIYTKEFVEYSKGVQEEKMKKA